VSAALGLPGLRGPGLGWLPAVLQRRATWRTVWRFLWLGPLIGGAPYAWMLVTLPFIYVFGAVPALLAGLLFAAWYHGPQGRVPSGPWRAALGALAGLGAATLFALGQLLTLPTVNWFFVFAVAAHGVPAATVLALLQKPAQAPAAPR
jgi:hypothetical protein